ncbi:MAG: RNA-binding protein [Fibrobacteria bacterium]|nr:RNA-binding protein [Fibrobacteria bacterium]
MNIYAGNLSFNMTEDELKNQFEQYGEVASANIIFDKLNGRSKGFGFVEMTDDAAGEQAIEALNGADVQGRKMKVNKALPKKESSPRKNWN